MMEKLEAPTAGDLAEDARRLHAAICDARASRERIVAEQARLAKLEADESRLRLRLAAMLEQYRGTPVDALVATVAEAEKYGRMNR